MTAGAPKNMIPTSGRPIKFQFDNAKNKYFYIYIQTLKNKQIKNKNIFFT